MGKPSIKEPLSEKIANILRQEILRIKITPNTHLNENTLSERFGVSRGPIREAFRMLNTEGFVDTLANGRTVALGFSPSDMEYYYKIRYFIESESIKKILDEPDSGDYMEWLSELEDMLKQSNVYLKQNDLTRFTDLDSDFHRSFIIRANVKVYLMTWNLLANTNKSIMEVNRTYLLNTNPSNHKDLHDINVTFAFHGSILNSLKQRDLNKTLLNLQTHLMNGTLVYAEILDAAASVAGSRPAGGGDRL